MQTPAAQRVAVAAGEEAPGEEAAAAAAALVCRHHGPCQAFHSCSLLMGLEGLSDVVPGLERQVQKAAAPGEAQAGVVRRCHGSVRLCQVPHRASRAWAAPTTSLTTPLPASPSLACRGIGRKTTCWDPSNERLGGTLESLGPGGGSVQQVAADVHVAAPNLRHSWGPTCLVPRTLAQTHYCTYQQLQAAA